MVFEFYGDYWHCHPDQFPDKNTIHPTLKDKDGNPMTVKDIRAQDHQHVQDLQDWQASLICHNIVLTLKSI